MAIAFTCPFCGEAYRLKDDLAGKRVTCRKANCRKQFDVPMAANGKPVTAPVDVEALAAAALSGEEVPAEGKPKGPQGTIKVTCRFCDHVFQADRAKEGKNLPCPECGRIIKVPMIKEEKPADWRIAGGGRPSLAKTEEKLEGAWDTERSYAKRASLEEAGALEVEEEEPEPGAKIRRIRNVMVLLAVLAGVAAGVMAFMKSRKEVGQERSLADAVKEVETEESLNHSPLFEGAILTAAGEHKARAIQKGQDLEDARVALNKAAVRLREDVASVERDGLLIDVAERMPLLGGSNEEAAQEKRLPWTGQKSVQKEIRQTLQHLSPDRDVRLLALRHVARKLPPQQAEMTVGLVQEILREELAEVIGQTAMELFLADKKEDARRFLEQAAASLADAPERATQAPSLTAARLALGGEQPLPLANLPTVSAPAGVQVPDVSRIAYAEGLAAQGKFDQARRLAEQPGNPEGRVRALTIVAEVALALKRPEDAGAAADAASKIIVGEMKGSPPSAWVVIRLASAAARAGKVEAANAAADTLTDDAKSWAKLELLRGRLAALGKQPAQDAWLDDLGDPAKHPHVTQALAREELARHNAKAGETGYAKTVETWPKGTMRPFGHAGLTLGGQDRSLSR